VPSNKEEEEEEEEEKENQDKFQMNILPPCC